MTSKLVHERLAVGPLQCNCYILADERSNEAVIVDPGGEPEEILERVRDMGVTVKLLLHTHCHFDHITGTRRVKEETGARILIHESDKALYEGLTRQYGATLRLFGVNFGSAEDPLPVDAYLKEGERVYLGDHVIQIIHTPGHTPGSCCFLLEGGQRLHLFSGDTLFAGSIGRTDLWGGNAEQELDSIRHKLFTLDADAAVYPGHGPETRIGDEKESNSFLQ